MNAPVSKNADRIDPRDWGVMFDGVTDDTANWQACLADIDPNSEVVMPTGDTLITDTLIFPATTGGNISLYGSGQNTSQFLTRGGGRIALGNYDPTGQFTGPVPVGGSYRDFSLQGNGTSDVQLHVGYMGGAKIDSVSSFDAGNNSVYISQTQDSQFSNLKIARWNSDGITLNYGANGNNFIGGNMYGSSGTVNSFVRIGSDDTTGSGSLKVFGPGNNTFWHMRYDKTVTTTPHGIRIESGENNMWFGCNMATSNMQGPWVHVAAPTGAARVARSVKFIGCKMRTTAANPAWIFEQDAGAGSTTYNQHSFEFCEFNGFQTAPLFRSPFYVRERGNRFNYGVATDANVHTSLHSGGQSLIGNPNYSDYEVSGDQNGYVVTDRGTGQRVRLFVSGGAVQVEPV